MPDENYGFSQTRARLEEIVAQVRKKNTSLEASLDLLEEGVRLANRCTELIDHADWEAAAGASDGGEEEPTGEDALSDVTENVAEEVAAGEGDDVTVSDEDVEWADEQDGEASDESDEDDESDITKDVDDAD